MSKVSLEIEDAVTIEVVSIGRSTLGRKEVVLRLTPVFGAPIVRKLHESDRSIVYLHVETSVGETGVSGFPRQVH